MDVLGEKLHRTVAKNARNDGNARKKFVRCQVEVQKNRLRSAVKRGCTQTTISLVVVLGMECIQ